MSDASAEHTIKNKNIKLIIHDINNKVSTLFEVLSLLLNKSIAIIKLKIIDTASCTINNKVNA